MYDRLEQCPVCKGIHFENFLICQDHSVSQESFAIVACKKCGFKFTNPRPTEEALPQYYHSENYISHTNKGNNLINIVYKIARHFTINNKIKFIKQFHPHGNLLDFGCGTGLFIKKVKENGWNVLGIEPSGAAREAIEDKMKPFVYSSIKNIRLKKYFHVITLWHVLEHVTDLAETLKKLRKLLHPEGKIIIAVPNVDAYDAAYYKEYWAAYDVPRHLYHFSPESMKRLLANHKLKLEEIHPMKLDAYYVSMLSERYKNKKNNYVKALKNGYHSNQWAKENKNNYSSLIFVAKPA